MGIGNEKPQQSTNPVNQMVPILGDPRLEKYPSRLLHLLDRASKVPGTSEAPLDVPSYAGTHPLDILRNGGVDLRPPARQLFLPHVEFLNVVCEEFSGDVHSSLQVNPSFFLDDGDEVVGRVAASLFFVVTVDILECQVLYQTEAGVSEKDLKLTFAVKSISPAILVRFHNAG